MVATAVATGVAAALLETIDAVIVASLILCRGFGLLLSRAIARNSKEAAPKPSVVIVGASFAGLWAQRALSDSFDVTLIDLKDYFEYTPGVLRLFVEPKHLYHIARPLPSRRCRSLVAEVTEVSPSQLSVRYPSGEIGTVRFDYLLLACGSLYPAVHGERVVKADSSQTGLAERAACWEGAARRLAEADDAIVVGGGPVGVELAAEIVAAYPDKRVVLVSRSERLCGALPDRVGDICLRWLQKRRVEVMRGVSTTSIREDGVTLEDGRELRAAVVYNCAGASANSAMLRTHFGAQLDSAGRLLVNDHLQVAGQPHIFGMGDLIHHPPSSELKLGHTAELNAHVVAHNIRAMHAGEPLARYPEGAHGMARSPQVFCVSLGKHAAALAFNGVTIGGWLPAVMKWLLEWTKVAACEERPVGTLFWDVADGMTGLISRTILPPPGGKLA